MTFRVLLPLAYLFTGVSGPALAQETVTDPSCRFFASGDHDKFQGMLTRLTFPGPPNYSSIAAGDAREQVIALIVPNEACWAFENHVFHTVGLQLLLKPTQLPVATRLIDSEVVVFGTATLAETGHHHMACCSTSTVCGWSHQRHPLPASSAT